MTKEQEKAKQALLAINERTSKIPVEHPSSVAIQSPPHPQPFQQVEPDNNIKYTGAQIVGQMGLDLFKIFDPTGVSSYGDVYDAYNQFDRDKSLENFGNLVWEGIGALPLLGKVKLPISLVKYAKAVKRGDTWWNTANKIIDVLDAPSRIIAPKLTKRIESLTNPLDRSKALLKYAPDGINIPIKTLNILNTSNDMINMREDINDIIKTNRNDK